ncbi:MAG: FAD-dependent monooxygenase [Legionella sp.]|nr:FAD-dependent monooxygenase [Legionella sp.]
MLALRGLGYSTLLVESKSFNSKINSDFDARSLALSPASQHILNALGVWELVKKFATPINTIHVSNQNSFGISRLAAKKDVSLGYVLEMQHLNQALYLLQNKANLLIPATLQSLELDKQFARVSSPQGVQIIHPRLIVAADGADSALRRTCQLPANIKLYQQQALVANIALAKPHHHCAYERFTEHGPLAMLPLQDNRMSLVWALSAEKIKQMMQISDGQFLKELQLVFGYRLGRFIKLGQRLCYPLKQVIMPQLTKWPVVFIGNAAHSLHPVAGQGFNLGLRDVATLAQCISQYGLEATMLTEYVKLRRHDQQAIALLTDGLVSLFTSKVPGIGLLRNVGLLAFDQSPFIKEMLVRYMRGFGGTIPDLVCEIALSSRSLNES